MFCLVFTCVHVNTVVIHLPNFDEAIADRVTMAIENAPGEMSDLTDGRSE